MNAPNRQHLVGIAQIKISDDPQDVIVAPNLGSCVGIAVYDKTLRRGGMVHCLLPLSKADPAKAAQNPCMYVDTGFAALLDQLMKMGSDKKNLTIIAAGGASINDDNNIFEIGKRNHTVLKKILWKNGLLLAAEHFGENYGRTLALHIDSGKATLKAKGETIEL